MRRSVYICRRYISRHTCTDTYASIHTYIHACIHTYTHAYGHSDGHTYMRHKTMSAYAHAGDDIRHDAKHTSDPRTGVHKISEILL